MSVKLMNVVWCLNLPGERKLSLLKFADHASDDGSGIFPSNATQAAYTSVSSRTARRRTSEFRRDGVLIAVANIKGGRRPVEYRMDIKRAVETYGLIPKCSGAGISAIISNLTRTSGTKPHS